MQAHPGVADHCHGSGLRSGGPGGFVVKHGDGAQFAQRLEHRGHVRHESGVTHHKQWQARGGRHIHLATQIAAGVHQLFQLGHMRLGLFVDLVGLALRIRRLADEGQRRHAVHDHGFGQRDAGHHRHFLPQCFGDERNHRVRQPQDAFERADQRAARGALLGVVTGLNLHLGDFQVPVAKFVPDKLVNAAGHVVEPVVGKAFGHVSFHALQRR